MTLDEAKARIAELEQQNALLQRENLVLETTAFTYRIVLEHAVAMSVAAGADMSEAAEVLASSRPRVGGHLRRVL